MTPEDQRNITTQWRHYRFRKKLILNTIDTFSCFVGPEVTYQIAVREVPGWFLALVYVWFFYILLFVSKTHCLSRNYAIPFSMLIYRVKITNCKDCDYWVIIRVSIYNINWRDVQIKNVVNSVDMSSLRASWQNGPYNN